MLATLFAFACVRCMAVLIRAQASPNFGFLPSMLNRLSQPSGDQEKINPLLEL